MPSESDDQITIIFSDFTMKLFHQIDQAVQIKHCVIAAPLVFMGAPPPRERIKLIESGTRRVTRVLFLPEKISYQRLATYGLKRNRQKIKQSIKRTITANFCEFSSNRNKRDRWKNKILRKNIFDKNTCLKMPERIRVRRFKNT